MGVQKERPPLWRAFRSGLLKCLVERPLRVLNDEVRNSRRGTVRVIDVGEGIGADQVGSDDLCRVVGQRRDVNLMNAVVACCTHEKRVVVGADRCVNRRGRSSGQSDGSDYTRSWRVGR